MAYLLDLSAAAIGVLTGPYVTVDTTNTLFGNGAVYFDGTLHFPVASNLTGHQLQSSDFSIDGWARWEGLVASYPRSVIVGKAASLNQSYFVGVTDAAKLFFTWSSDGTGSGSTTIRSSTSVDTGYFHFEITRSGSTVYLFLNGILEASASIANFHNSSQELEVGRINVAGSEYYWKGQIRELRVTKGAARHTSSFTVPTSAPPADGTDPNYSSTTLFLRLDGPYVHSTAKTEPKTWKIVGSSFSLSKKYVGSLHINVKDTYFGGRGRIIATVKEKNTPVNTPLRRKVWLIRERDAQIVRETWSDAATGAYAFTYIDETEKYSVVSYDYPKNYRAVIADNLTPELMP